MMTVFWWIRKIDVIDITYLGTFCVVTLNNGIFIKNIMLSKNISHLSRICFCLSYCTTCCSLSSAPDYTAGGCIYEPMVITAKTEEFVIGGLRAKSPTDKFCKVRLLQHSADQSYDVTVQFYSVQVCVIKPVPIYRRNNQHHRPIWGFKKSPSNGICFIIPGYIQNILASGDYCLICRPTESR